MVSGVGPFARAARRRRSRRRVAVAVDLAFELRDQLVDRGSHVAGRLARAQDGAVGPDRRLRDVVRRDRRILLDGQLELDARVGQLTFELAELRLRVAPNRVADLEVLALDLEVASAPSFDALLLCWNLADDSCERNHVDPARAALAERGRGGCRPSSRSCRRRRRAQPCRAPARRGRMRRATLRRRSASDSPRWRGSGRVRPSTRQRPGAPSARRARAPGARPDGGRARGRASRSGGTNASAAAPGRRRARARRARRQRPQRACGGRAPSRRARAGERPRRKRRRRGRRRTRGGGRSTRDSARPARRSGRRSGGTGRAQPREGVAADRGTAALRRRRRRRSARAEIRSRSFTSHHTHLHGERSDEGFTRV